MAVDAKALDVCSIQLGAAILDLNDVVTNQLALTATVISATGFAAVVCFTLDPLCQRSPFGRFVEEVCLFRWRLDARRS